MLQRKINDECVLRLISIILKHGAKAPCKGMPLGNLTSQIFANLYLNDLDQFVKHKLKIKYYVRYVDDFVILHENKIFHHSNMNSFYVSFLLASTKNDTL